MSSILFLTIMVLVAALATAIVLWVDSCAKSCDKTYDIDPALLIQALRGQNG